jgi:aerobic carbon-monoxide dehydrogenase medium subunit
VKPAAFVLHRPRDLDDALALLTQHGADACLIAGGQSLVPMMNLRLATPSVLIDLNGVDTLAGIRRDGDVLRIGAGTRQQTALESDLVQTYAPLLAAALRHVGHYATRCRGTIGGSLANADPASELVLAAVTLRAQVTLRDAATTRTVAAGEFFLDAMTTALKPGEILTEIVVPVAPEGTKVSFREHARRHGDFAIAAAAVQHSPKDNRLSVGLGAISTVPVICRRVEDGFRAGSFAAALDGLVAAEIAGIDCLSDLRASASYRGKLAAICLADCVREAIR